MFAARETGSGAWGVIAGCLRAARASRLKEALGRRRDPRPPGARGRELGKFRNEECVFCVKSFLRSFRTSPIMTSINVTLIDGLM
ncbi:hypothetical protein [Burkholderia pseudomallei]|uniref:hypothetical protein n=1 Tax=Burkholderia pseudomallei TaxID=28450 RepID=UPI000B2BB98E|nr:hypothetical protein [Burkholderia pseudomallei]